MMEENRSTNNKPQCKEIQRIHKYINKPKILLLLSYKYRNERIFNFKDLKAGVSKSKTQMKDCCMQIA